MRTIIFSGKNICPQFVHIRRQNFKVSSCPSLCRIPCPRSSLEFLIHAVDKAPLSHEHLQSKNGPFLNFVELFCLDVLLPGPFSVQIISNSAFNALVESEK